MKKINVGYTNISYLDNNCFYQEKKYNEFNHKSNYELLKIFDFVPKLIENKNEFSRWEWIDAKQLDDPSNDDLKQMANILNKLHNSNMELAKFNIRKRIEKYRKIMNEKNIRIPIINDLYKKINNILKNMDKTKPIHGDLWKSNILIDKNKKIWLVDWEYSHMGDIHFELAYFIESYELDEEKEKIFLDEYKDYDETLLTKHKILVNYLTVLWLYSNDELFYSPNNLLKRLKQLIKLDGC